MTTALIYDESLSTELSDHDIDSVSTFHQPAFVRESHPVGSARFGGTALTQLPYLFQRRDHQFDPCPRIDQGGLVLLIVEHLGLDRVQHLVGEFYNLARLRPLYG